MISIIISATDIMEKNANHVIQSNHIKKIVKKYTSSSLLLLVT